MSTIYDFEVKKPDGELLSLKEYEGKPLVIVNTASKCGFTPQFGGLQELYEDYKDQGLTILGFPCDQFNDQEFENIEETTEFCQVNYGVTFPMFAKVDVNGESAEPLFTHLTSEKKGMLSKKIKWNFTKFLVDRNGQVVERYAPQTAPEKLAADVEKLL
ncbi:glutathione peroxidase [Sporosarcina aquimarina]|uniref:Glutathione peroxidase n=1 Tax=Sporosarcina aquimarina TaxID=114975 RepID=A0ABU4FYH2_9BACL|nr:glutathione peroxidase [Sporosarcina aquimarina]MDW0109770.1 glutathione peroxidase [Sporosarcina aquimarina]